jgi:uncharacterized protein YkwD
MRAARHNHIAADQCRSDMMTVQTDANTNEGEEWAEGATETTREHAMTHVRVRYTLSAAVLAAVFAVVSATPAQAGTYTYLLAPTNRCPNQTNSYASAPAQESAMRCLFDYARARSGGSAGGFSYRLNDSSDYKAYEILLCNQFSHYACGRPWDFWIQREGFHGLRGEILAWNAGRVMPRTIMNAWLYSAPHRAVILNRRFNYRGSALRTGRLGSKYAWVWVGHFAR